MSTAPDKPTKAFSCIRCFERKVKCDKENPCSNCVKSRVECIFRVPPAPRRRKKRPQEEMLLARLKQCEDLLKSKGVDLDRTLTPSENSAPTGNAASDDGGPSPDLLITGDTRNVFPGPNSRNGQLIVDHGKSRFIENNLWTSVSEEFRPKEAFVDYTTDEEDDAISTVEESPDFLLGITPSSNFNSISRFHPSSDNIFKLWQVFLDNINPMTKLIHQPTLHQTIVQSTSQLENLPKGLEALLFAIYLTAVTSLDNEECEMKLGETRKVLLSRYSHATRAALARSKFMASSELEILQAFILYLLSMRDVYDSRTMWSLAGVASRIGQGMGLHRDGTFLGVSPFETELRRRLWWQIAILDFRSAELSGSGRFGDFGLSDTKTPRNVNDADLSPDMVSEPEEQTRPTEMIACLLRCEFGRFWKEKLVEKKSGVLERLRLESWKSSMEERDAHINELEQRLEEKFLRYCDPSIPIQFLAIIIARAAVNSMRLMAHHPRKYGNAEDYPPEEREFMWNIAFKLIESDNLAHSSRGLKRFMWHTNNYFQWQAFIHLLNELKSRTLGDDADRAWEQVDEVFSYHPNFISVEKKPLHAAIGSLCLKAYSAREKALRETTNGVYPKVVPEYIRILRERRLAATTRRMKQENTPTEVPTAATAKHAPITTTAFSSQQVSNPQDSPFDARPAFSYPYTTTQMPLPPVYQPFQFQAPSSENLMFNSDPALAQELAMSDMPMDWAQWDMLMQDFEAPREAMGR